MMFYFNFLIVLAAIAELGTCTDDIDCNFEEDQCTWFQDPSVSFRWTKTQEASVDSSAGPSSDHTTGAGYFYGLNTSSDSAGIEGSKAQLIGWFHIPARTYCFSFWYYMNGEDSDTLSVYIKHSGSAIPGDIRVFTISASQGDNWKEVKMTINPTRSFQLVFEGIKGSSSAAYMAIDDISVHPRSCYPTGPALAFTAVISSIVLPDLERFDRLTFDDVLTNVGGAYDETEGTFVAPFDAVYIFTIDIMLQGGTHQYLDIMRNTVRMLDVYLEATPTNYLSSSRTVTMQLATGDEVWIRINAGDRSIYGNHQSTFSGWLVTVL